MPGMLVSPLFEVILFADWPTRYGAAGRWFILGVYPSRGGAWAAFREITAELPDPRIQVALVQSTPDPSGRFVDRIVEARGRLPMIERAKLVPLTEDVREDLREPEVVRSVNKPAPKPRRKGMGWVLPAAATLGALVLVGGFLALR